MRSYVDFLDRYKVFLIALTTVIVVLFSISLKDISYEGNYRIWFDKESQIIKDYDNFRDTFSGDDSFLISFKEERGIFTKKPIETILKLTEKFKKLEGVQKVNSLSNYQYIFSEDEDLIVEDFFYDVENLVEKKKIALADNLIANQLISKDGKTTLISVRLNKLSGVDEDLNIKLMAQIEEILQKEKELTGYEFQISGAPAITASLVTISQGDAKVLLPMAVVIVTILLFTLFRDLIGVIVPSVVIVFTFLLVLSQQILLGYQLNNFTVNIPPFITAIAIASSMHFFLGYIYYKQKGEKNKNSVYLALKKNIVPIGMTSFTTAVGFASLGVSAIEPIGTLGVAITTGAVLGFLFTVSIAPAILLFLKDSYEFKKISLFNFLNVKGYGDFIVRNDKKIVAFFVVLLVVVGAGISFIKVDSNSIKYFSKESRVRSGSDFVEKNLTGSMVYEIILDSKSKEGTKNPQFLKTIVDFEEQLKSRYSNITFSISLKDIIVRMDRELNEKEKGEIPKNQNLVAQYLLLYSMSLPQGEEINDKIDTNERFLRLSINSNIVDTSKDLEMIEWIKNWWKNSSKYSADVQGQTAVFAYMQSSVTDTLVISILITLLIVSISMFLIFKKFKMLWIFTLPNIAPIIFVAGVMGYLGINIDIGIAISAAVILGIAVDDSIHFFSKYFDGIKTKTFPETIDYIISHSGNAMILTTFILSLTFSLFMVSSFVPNVNFAIVTIIALNIALVLDLVLLPALLSLFFHRKKSI